MYRMRAVPGTLTSGTPTVPTKVERPRLRINVSDDDDDDIVDDGDSNNDNLPVNGTPVPIDKVSGQDIRTVIVGAADRKEDAQNDTNERLARLESMLTSRIDSLEHNVKHLDTLKAPLNDLVRKIASLEEEDKTLKGSIGMMKTTSTALTGRLSRMESLASRIEALEKKGMLPINTDELTNTMQDLDRKFAFLEEKNTELHKITENFTKTVDLLSPSSPQSIEAAKQLTELTDRIKTLEIQTKAIGDQTKGGPSNTDLDKRITDISSENADIKRKQDDLEGKINASEKEILNQLMVNAKRMENIDALQSGLQEATEQLVMIQDENTDLKNKYWTIGKVLEINDAGSSDILSRLISLTDKVSVVEARSLKCDDLATTVKTLDEKLAACEGGIAELKNSVVDLRGKLQNSENEAKVRGEAYSKNIKEVEVSQSVADGKIAALRDEFLNLKKSPVDTENGNGLEVISGRMNALENRLSSLDSLAGPTKEVLEKMTNIQADNAVLKKSLDDIKRTVALSGEVKVSEKVATSRSDQDRIDALENSVADVKKLAGSIADAADRKMNIVTGENSALKERLKQLEEKVTPTRARHWLMNTH
ncbi:uncharacterized protein [Bemisia tabaci]